MPVGSPPLHDPDSAHHRYSQAGEPVHEQFQPLHKTGDQWVGSSDIIFSKQGHGISGLTGELLFMHRLCPFFTSFPLGFFSRVILLQSKRLHPKSNASTRFVTDSCASHTVPSILTYKLSAAGCLECPSHARRNHVDHFSGKDPQNPEV